MGRQTESQRVKKSKGNANKGGGEDNPPNSPPTSAPSNQRQRNPTRRQAAPTDGAAQDTLAVANELEGLRQQVRRLTEEHAASLEATKSLEGTNKSLEAKLAELGSSRAGRVARPNARKKKRIRRPKGSKWKLINEMGLAHDEDKYKRIVQKLKNLKKEAGFKDGALFAEQSRDKIVKYCKAARKQVVYLRRFKGDWATTAYLHRSFSNRRGYLSREDDINPKPADENGAGPSGTRHDDDGDGSSDNDDDLGKEDDQDDFMDDSEDGDIDFDDN